jgi:hypothetical protein
MINPKHSETEFSLFSDLLGENTYFFGEQISRFDIVTYSHLCEFISVGFLMYSQQEVTPIY